MIGVVIPVHNEEAALGACLEAVAASARHPGLCDEDVLVVVALDACTDGSRAIAQRARVEILELDARRVGAARASGAALAVAFGARWLAGLHRCGHRRIPRVACKPGRARRRRSVRNGRCR